jgi:hypothetical protein
MVLSAQWMVYITKETRMYDTGHRKKTIDVIVLHTISIPAYAIEQQWRQSRVPKNEMSLIIKSDARFLARCVTMRLFFKNMLTRQ